MYTEDLISRQAAIDAIDRLDIPEDMCVFEILSHIELEIGNLPSAQPEQIARDIATIIENEKDMRVILKNAERTETHSCDCERTATHDSRREWYMKGYRDAQSAAMHESCTDCPLYDHDKHNCPRFNKVIPTAILDAQPRWIPCEECEKRCEKWENSKT